MGKWRYKIPVEYASSLRDACDEGDALEAQGALLAVLAWIKDNIPEIVSAESLYDDVTMVDDSDFDSTEEFADEIDSYLSDFYDMCDMYRIWIPIDIGASTKITASRGDDEVADPRIEEADDLQGRVEDDFSYVIAGIERLVREGMLDEAISILNSLSDTLNSAINIIGNDFDNNKSEE